MTKKTLTERQATDKQLWNLLFQMSKFADRKDHNSHTTNHVAVGSLTSYFRQQTELAATDTYKMARVRAFNNNVLAECLTEACRIYELDDSNRIAIKTDSIKSAKNAVKHSKTEKHISQANLHLINTIQVVRDSDDGPDDKVGHLRYAFINTDTNDAELTSKVDDDMRTISILEQQDYARFILDERQHADRDFIIEINADQFVKAVKKVTKATAEFYDCKPRYNDFDINIYFIEGKFMVGRADAGSMEVLESEVLQPQASFNYTYPITDGLESDFMAININTGHLLPCLEMFGKDSVRFTASYRPSDKPLVMSNTNTGFASIECAVMPLRLDFKDYDNSNKRAEVLSKVKAEALKAAERSQR